MFKLDMDRRPLEQLENDLDSFGEKALPYAIKDTLNTAAFKTADLSKKKARQLFTMRNKFTERSIRFQKTFASRIDDMESAAGSVQMYMAKQQEGFTRHSSETEGIRLPTSAAAGQKGASPRTSLVKRMNYLSRLEQSRKIRKQYKNTKQAVLRRVQEAVESGDRVIYLGIRGKASRKYKKGYYRVIGGEKVKRGWPTGARLELLYETEHRSLRTGPSDWIGPPTRFVSSKIGEYYREALIRQIERQMIFRNKR